MNLVEHASVKECHQYSDSIEATKIEEAIESDENDVEDVFYSLNESHPRMKEMIASLNSWIISDTLASVSVSSSNGKKKKRDEWIDVEPKPKHVKRVATSSGHFQETALRPPAMKFFTETSVMPAPHGFTVEWSTYQLPSAPKSKKRGRAFNEHPGTWDVEDLFDNFERMPCQKRQRQVIGKRLARRKHPIDLLTYRKYRKAKHSS